MNHIKRVRSNVKGERDVTLGPKTLVVGPNGAGKTALLQSILFATDPAAYNAMPELGIIGRQLADVLTLRPAGAQSVWAETHYASELVNRGELEAGRKAGHAHRPQRTCGLHAHVALVDTYLGTFGEGVIRGFAVDREAHAALADNEQRLKQVRQQRKEAEKELETQGAALQHRRMPTMEEVEEAQAEVDALEQQATHAYAEYRREHTRVVDEARKRQLTAAQTMVYNSALTLLEQQAAKDPTKCPLCQQPHDVVVMRDAVHARLDEHQKALRVDGYGWYDEVQKKLTLARGRLDDLLAARALVQRVADLRDRVAHFLAATQDAKAVRDAQKRAVQRGLIARTAELSAMLSALMPDDEPLAVRFQDGDRSVVRVGIDRRARLSTALGVDDGIHFALCGAEMTRVALATAIVHASHEEHPANGGDGGVTLPTCLLLPDRAFDRQSLRKTLLAVNDAPVQIIATSTIPDTDDWSWDEQLPGWTIVRL